MSVALLLNLLQRETDKTSYTTRPGHQQNSEHLLGFFLLSEGGKNSTFEQFDAGHGKYQIQ